MYTIIASNIYFYFLCLMKAYFIKKKKSKKFFQKKNDENTLILAHISKVLFYLHFFKTYTKIFFKSGK